MNTLFVKTQNLLETEDFTFNGLGISQCYVKSLDTSIDSTFILRKTHRHAGYEAHIVITGSQDYEIENKKIKISAGEILFVPPFIRHRVLCETKDYSKRAIFFTLNENSKLISKLSFIKSYVIAKSNDKLISNLNFLETEKTKHVPLSESISSLVTLESILLLLRLVGVKNDSENKPVLLEDTRVTLAKEYIKDNIQKGVTLSELESYCYLGTKQLSRLFEKNEKCTVPEYIRAQRVKHIEKLLLNKEYSLREISEMMNFSSEYYFNAFFKKHVGITPGAYRKNALNKI